LNKYKFEIGQHRDKNVIWVLFPNDATLRNELKQHFPSVQFSGSKKCWYLSDPKKNRVNLKLVQNGIGVDLVHQIHLKFNRISIVTH
ncbi:MAG TPA: hypothetical protein PKA15_03130, partial [Chitinophagales bacterium]|nr:hypothetical protein [Chitinophagales bacterium]